MDMSVEDSPAPPAVPVNANGSHVAGSRAADSSSTGSHLRRAVPRALSRPVEAVQRAFRSRRWPARAAFVLLNVWIVYHLAAVVIAPWSVPPSSRLVQNGWRAVGAYVQVLYLNHGYHYFAPEPGNSTL